MAEIWSPATFSEDVFAYKISALYHFQSYKAFSGGIQYYLVISTKSFITLKEQVIVSWNFVSPNIFKNVPGDQISAISVEKWQIYWEIHLTCKDPLELPTPVLPLTMQNVNTFCFYITSQFSSSLKHALFSFLNFKHLPGSSKSISKFMQQHEVMMYGELLSTK